MNTHKAALFLVLIACACVHVSCSKKQSGAQTQTVVLYSSVDEPILRPIVQAFEEKTGINVQLASDTEATKTTGLATRLRNEKNRPRADVWWSSEPMWTVQLASEGVFEPIDQSIIDDATTGTAWPESCIGENHMWIGFGLRARVIAYNTEALDESSLPTTLAELADPEYKGRVGMAKPEFGTTRAHMAALCSTWGNEAFESWLTAMHENGLRLYDGNSSAVRAVALGEIDFCLTDTDDIWNAQTQDWPVGVIYETIDDTIDPPSHGALLLANTVAKVRNDAHSDEADRLLNFLLSEDVERMLMESTSRNVPIRASLAEELFTAHPQSRVDTPWFIHPNEISAAESDAMQIVDRVLN
ncbi:MAG: extracellular solute-binding protein [Phycisphaeraceae bacterium]|nr:extracellular solute-binding protein [Phycisphaerales bacterium]MCB9859627.1 extracellular solute-binding protein [Phycisphaeraceae bacterium]